MAIKQTLDVINAMEADGIIGRYAIAGAVAAYNYIEPTVTDDLDILVSFNTQPGSGLIRPSHIFSYLKSKGYADFRKEGIVIEGWPVQFLPVANDLEADALAQAEDIVVLVGEQEGPVTTRVLRPEHVVAIALKVGRPKDFIRITQFLQENAVGLDALCAILDRHDLGEAWRVFCQRTGTIDPCGVRKKP
jgi:hypothetical protein